MNYCSINWFNKHDNEVGVLHWSPVITWHGFHMTWILHIAWHIYSYKVTNDLTVQCFCYSITFYSGIGLKNVLWWISESESVFLDPEYMMVSLQHEQVVKSTQVTARVLTCLCCISPAWHWLSTVTKGADGGIAGGIGCHFCSWGSGEKLSQEVYLNAPLLSRNHGVWAWWW